MKILVMHQVPYRKVQYHLSIDHQQHDVWYFGTPDGLAQLPEGLCCERVALEPGADLAGQIVARTGPEDGFEAVLALSEFGILEAVRVREHLNLPGPDAASMELVRDKVAMKQALVGAGVRHPRFASWPLASTTLPWTGRTVVKPRRGASSEGVTIHPGVEEALARLRTLPDADGYQLEEYIDGAVLHADALVADGEVEHLVVSRYVGRPVDFTEGLPIGSSQHPTQQRHRDFVTAAVSALRIESGCIHLEFFETGDGEPVFLEVANRLGGGGIVDSHLRHTGVHLPSHEIARRLGFEPPALQPRSGSYHGFLIFPGHRSAGAAATVVVPQELRDHPCVDRIHVLDRRDSGGTAPGRVTYQEWEVPVFVEASHPDPSVLARFIARCAAEIQVRTEESAVRTSAVRTEESTARALESTAEPEGALL